jgi:cell wall-associated NlpC family hydrolase
MAPGVPGGKPASLPADSLVLRSGDILFITSKSTQAAAIGAATHSPWTHVGVYWRGDESPQVIAASGSGVRWMDLSEFLALSRTRHWMVRRLKDADARLTPDVLAKLHRELTTYLGRPYDWLFKWDDTSIYCSELIWKAYERGLHLPLCEPQTMGELDYRGPEARQMLRDRFHLSVNGQGWAEFSREKVVTPEALARSQELITVYEGVMPTNARLLPAAVR